MIHHFVTRRTGWFASLVFGLGAVGSMAQDDPAAEFRKACAEAATGAAKSMVVPGQEGWLFLTNELRHIGVGQFWGDKAAAASKAKAQDADPLPAILDFKKQLDALGIELILAPVPPKAVIFPDKLPGAPAAGGDKAPVRLDAVHQEFYKLLRDQGVNVLDLTDTFLAGRMSDDGPMYCLQDTHWSGHACVVAAKEIAGLIGKMDWYAGIERTKFNEKEVKQPIKGDLLGALPADKRPEPEAVKLRVISDPAGGVVKPDPNSPVILLGDSHNLVFNAGGDMHTTGAGLPDQLAFELGFPVDLLAVRGSGATPARINLYRRGSSQKDYFSKKKVVVWCFTAREFTESQGWRLVPVSKK